MATDVPQTEVEELRTDEPAKQPIEDALTYSIRNEQGWITYSTDNEDAFLNEVQRRRDDASEEEKDLNPEGGDPDLMLKQREEAEAAQREAAAAAADESSRRLADVKPKIDARTDELKDSPNKLARAVAKLEFRVRGLLQEGDDV